MCSELKYDLKNNAAIKNLFQIDFDVLICINYSIFINYKLFYSEC